MDKGGAKTERSTPAPRGEAGLGETLKKNHQTKLKVKFKI